ncbi:Oxidoreductase, molybdopterin binding (modular protein) [uncultured Sphingopyxis sp.]|uniref:Oxidoreductase, molybdopterin binding (Modular protein) n=1 Tax=uncultured Sphingopyxis sp. TaxID=310581 RepID=A0A1Y5Q1Y4_9SPHN|nr:Oxidoreductase, molybdopterin binding (modular protein) [uncultured Sphingopyxis sp.]
MSSLILPRRELIARAGGLVAAAGALPLLSGCDAINEAPVVRTILSMGEEMNRASQRALIDRDALAREFTRADLSPYFRPNGTRLPAGSDYAAHAASGFVDWRVKVSGLVARPLSLSLADIRAMPQRTQITRHDCVEGWSAIGGWTGVQLRRILAAAGVKDSARYIVFRCADRLGDALYYESCDMVDALHPQTILAWALGDAVLPIANGAPLRLADLNPYFAGAAGVRRVRQGAAQPERRAAAPAHRAPARLQARQICERDRGGREPRPYRRGQGRLLGGPRRL